MIFNPDPKPKTIRKKGAEYTQLRWDAFFRAAGLCERCGRWAPFDNLHGLAPGQLSHQGRSGGGMGMKSDDTLENVDWVCWKCHALEHAGNL